MIELGAVAQIPDEPKTVKAGHTRHRCSSLRSVHAKEDRCCACESRVEDGYSTRSAKFINECLAGVVDVLPPANPRNPP